jgi:hypothetical protein
MSNGRKKTKKSQSGKSARPARGRVVHIGPRPKMPLIIAGVFGAGVLMLILATLFSPRKPAAPAAAGETTNAPVTASAPATNTPAATNAPATAPAVTNAPAQ